MCSFHSVLMRLMLVSVIYYIWRERNAHLYGDAPCISLMIYREIVSCIVSKVNYIRNMTSSITTRRLHIQMTLKFNIFCN